jgi:hypothetical protein
VSGDLVEDQRQGEGNFLVLEADVAIENRAVTEVRGGLLDDVAVGFELRVAAPLIVIRHVPPDVVTHGRPRGSRATASMRSVGLDLPVVKVTS